MGGKGKRLGRGGVPVDVFYKKKRKTVARREGHLLPQEKTETEKKTHKNKDGKENPGTKGVKKRISKKGGKEDIIQTRDRRLGTGGNKFT